jgi:hypothetical protein
MANNPLDYLIKDPNAMRYALMQDAGYKGGGAVKMSKGGDPAKEIEEFNRFEAAGAPAYVKPLEMEGRGTFLPFKDNLPGSVMNTRELALPGILAGAYNAFTSPARSVKEIGFNDMEEAVNFALNMMGGGVGLGRAAPAPAGSLGMNVSTPAMRQFKQMVAREAPEQYRTITDAMRQSAQTGLEHSVVGNTHSGGESFITRGTKDSVVPNDFDVDMAIYSPGSPNIVDFHTHPAKFTTFGVNPSPQDLAFYLDTYRRMAKDRELRTLIAIPPERVEFLSQDIARPRTAYNLFATNDPSTISAKTADEMRYELQKAGRRGGFDEVRSDPRFKEYFDNFGGNIGDTLGDASALLMQRYRALQGKGRHELQLSGAPLDSTGAVVDSALFEALLNPAMQVLKNKKFAEGGPVNMEGGGAFNPQGADYDYQTARAYGMGQDGGNWGSVAPTSDDERKLHGLPEDSYLMLKGAQHPTWGKAVEAEESRGSRIVKHGDRYYSVPSKAEGGEVSQSELDRMRYELDRANSPVMQATPRSPIQDFIGTAGGYMDRAGRFITQAIEPIAEKNPVKTFLADMLLAAPLRGAGTALQDYTGTVRETDEDNPVRGVISKDFRNLTTSREPMLDPRVLDIAQFATPVVKGATKLAGAGAKAIAPFATRVDDMVRELSASGAIPQPGLSIKDVTNNRAPIEQPKATAVTPNDVVNPNGIEPPHSVRDVEKKEKLIQDMEQNGWVGRPILVFDVGRGNEALTGSHRIAAAKQVGIEVPIYKIDESIGDYADKNGNTIFDAAYFEPEDIVKFLKEFGDKDAVKLMQQETVDDAKSINKAQGGQVKQPFTPPQYLNYNIDHMRHELMRQG